MQNSLEFVDNTLPLHARIGKSRERDVSNLAMVRVHMVYVHFRTNIFESHQRKENNRMPACYSCKQKRKFKTRFPLK